VNADRSPSLLAWQWSGYAAYHGSRRNLVIHLVTQPIFVMGFFSLLSAPLGGSLVGIVARALGGIVAMALAMIAQGRGHAIEASPPIPFAGPGDALGRIFLEQLVNFPRFVLSGGLAKAWRESA
jgi:hypothetical protein